MWRKRRLRLAEAAAHRRGLGGTLPPYRETVKAALVHLDTTGASERVVDAICATAADTEAELAEMANDEAMTHRALELLGSKRNDAYEAALASLREDTQAWWADVLEPDGSNLTPPTFRACLSSRRATIPAGWATSPIRATWCGRFRPSPCGDLRSAPGTASLAALHKFVVAMRGTAEMPPARRGLKSAGF
jgi:hypothetical protein